MKLATRSRGIAVCAWLTTALLAFGQSPAVDSNGTPMFPNEFGPLDHPIRFFGSVDYLLFAFRDAPAPPLIQHVPTNLLTTPLDPNAAQTLFGNGIGQGTFNGFYASGGFWLTDCFGFDGSYVKFQEKTKTYTIASNGDPSIGRYYYDITNNSTPQTYLIYANPNGSANGAISASAPSKFWFGDFNVRTHGYTVFSDRVDWIAGFRYASLAEGLVVDDVTTLPAAPITYTGEDRFETDNKFYGAQVGFDAWTGLCYGFTLDVTGKLALGAVCEKVDISGYTVATQNGVVTQVIPGDVLTQTTNIGSYKRTKFAAMPELMIKLGYQVTTHVNLSLGYDIVAISNVMRPGSAIDEGVNPNVNPTLIPSSASTIQRPAFDFSGTDFWAQGLTLGISVYY
jgi:hypothetical protein